MKKDKAARSEKLENVMHESTGEYVKDSVITTKVKALLAKDDLLNSVRMGVKTYAGIVQLSGFVDSPQTVYKAAEITSSVKGVKSIFFHKIAFWR